MVGSDGLNHWEFKVRFWNSRRLKSLQPSRCDQSLAGAAQRCEMILREIIPNPSRTDQNFSYRTWRIFTMSKDRLGACLKGSGCLISPTIRRWLTQINESLRCNLVSTSISVLKRDNQSRRRAVPSRACPAFIPVACVDFFLLPISGVGRMPRPKRRVNFLNWLWKQVKEVRL